MISVHSKMTTSLVAGGLLMLAVLMPATVPAAPVTGACSPTKMKYSASNLYGSSTTSKTFVDIPEASISFTQGTARTNCVIVRFSAETYVATSGDDILVRAFIAGATALPSGGIIYSSSHAGVGTHSFEFIFPSVAPGNYVVRMQFRCLDGTSVAVNRHNTVVQYAP